MRQQPESSQSTLLGAALFYARGMGWPVLPLTHRVPGRSPVMGCSCGLIGCALSRAHPVDARASDELGTLMRWWNKEPYNVGIPTGRFVDALEVPAAVGAAVANSVHAASTDLGPVLAFGDRYQFLIRPGASIPVYGALRALGRPAAQFQLRYLGIGDLLVAPPSMLSEQAAHWVREPDLTMRDLPDALSVLLLLAQAASGQRGEVVVRMDQGAGRIRS
jgi:hypothetical protein